MPELDELCKDVCPLPVKGVENKAGKANVLMQVRA